jgi:glycosyltransferase involved in cell wall biosynthesis
VYFVIAGPEHHPGIAARMEEICEREGFDAYVQIPGPVTGREKLDLFLSSSVFVLPSYVENFPYTVLEAMAAGLPVVAFAADGVAETVVHGETGFLAEVGDVAALAGFAARLVEDAALRAEMGQRGRERVATLFTAQRMAEQVAQVIEQVLWPGKT